MQILGETPINEIRGILGARFIFAVPHAGQDWEMAVLKDGQWYSINYDQLKTLNMSDSVFYNNAPIPPLDNAQYYIAVPKIDQQWSAPAGIFRGEKWMPISEQEMRDMAEKFTQSNVPANVQTGL